MKKITILCFDLDFGGIQKIISDLSNELIKDYNIDIVSVYKYYDKPFFDFDKKINIKCLTNLKPNHIEFKRLIKGKKYINAFFEGLKSLKIIITKKNKLRKFLKNLNTDYLITTRHTLNKYVDKYVKDDNIIKISWEHNHPLNNDNYVNNIVKVCKHYNYLIVVSKEIENIYKKVFKDSNSNCIVKYIPNFLPNTSFKINKLDNKNIISVGRFELQKGFMDLVKIMKIIEKKDDKIYLNLVGDGSLFNEIKNYINDYNIKNIKLYGHLSSNEVNKIYKKSSLYVMTSIFEPFGIVMIEAMSHGIPIVAFSSAHGANEIVINGVNGYILNNRNLEDMANLIISTINNKDKLIELGKNAIESNKRYSKDNSIKKWKNILK